jgi:hypothetical protein
MEALSVWSNDWPRSVVAASHDPIPLLILATGIAIIVVLVLWNIRDMPFDARRWHAPAAKLRRKTWRLRMASWLVKKKVLLGKTRSEVVEMLGPPLDVPWFKGPNQEFFDLYEVNLFCNELALAVKFDDHGRVTEAAFAEA